MGMCKECKEVYSALEMTDGVCKNCLERKKSLIQSMISDDLAIKIEQTLSEITIFKAEKGDVKSQLFLALNLIGINNRKEAFNWIKISAENDYPLSQLFMGDFYLDGEFPVRQNDSEAFHWYKSAFYHDLEKAIEDFEYYLRELYKETFSVLHIEYNDEIRLFLDEMLQELNLNELITDAEFNMGILYLRQKNLSFGKEWLRKAANKGHKEANNRLKKIRNAQIGGAVVGGLTGLAIASQSDCFIATAVYNSPTAPKVMVLREFRDQKLLTNKAGERFVQFYYRNSPPIANFLSRHKFLSEVVRVGFIEPLVWGVRKLI